ncbi:EF-hand [Basidiobolus meristosporus CBS 931.73]|uniref:EF-hand n=1 Tax=Basidiobolus meristosporus CBS 931.73 TaxID=1314790 RepID=A0A1Y1YI26_9FUNG|nr:EF-hand [Basidiobolus meristosporus CBS 931.73]|eukprot:ORX97264.1 EF-hand [Basidiobolus meristosporus CBS 931.73]
MMKRECKSVDAFAFYLLKQRGNDFLVPDDFDVILRDVMSGHQELDFLVGNDSFQDRYAETVIARIFYDHNRSWTGRMSFAEFKRGKIVTIIRRAELGIDCGHQTRRKKRSCFSYKDFYVIYSKFWELDDDHDLEISETDLCYYAQGSLTERIVKRVIEGCGKPTDLASNKERSEPHMSYRDFVWFILSEVNKNTPTAIEYWFRCLDTDGDGLLSLYELEHFYEEQMSRMEYARVKRIPYMDSICQMFDLINPTNKSFVTLSDLKRMREPAVFFDMFFNLARYIEHENRPKKLRMRRKMGGRHNPRLGSNPWDEYVDIEYDRLIPPLGDEDDEDTDGDIVFGAHQGDVAATTPSTDQPTETLINEGESSTVTSY